MTASAFTSVSLDPLLVLVCVDKEARFRDAVLESGIWGVSVLSRAGRRAADWFATKGRPLVGQLDRFPHHRGQVTGAALLDDALAWLECRTARRSTTAATTTSCSARSSSVGRAATATRAAAGLPPQPLRPDHLTVDDDTARRRVRRSPSRVASAAGRRVGRGWSPSPGSACTSPPARGIAKGTTVLGVADRRPQPQAEAGATLERELGDDAARPDPRTRRRRRRHRSRPPEPGSPSTSTATVAARRRTQRGTRSPARALGGGDEVAPVRCGRPAALRPAVDHLAARVDRRTGRGLAAGLGAGRQGQPGAARRRPRAAPGPRRRRAAGRLPRRLPARRCACPAADGGGRPDVTGEAFERAAREVGTSRPPRRRDGQVEGTTVLGAARHRPRP